MKTDEEIAKYRVENSPLRLLMNAIGQRPLKTEEVQKLQLGLQELEAREQESVA